ncbi:MAG TPA: GNAT family N-acetyltransferase [Propylenella sp.]
MVYLEASLPPERLGLLAAGMAIQSEMHPREPHWYLPWMGVVPEAQGMELGSALLRIGLSRADADGLPAYLEATSRRNAALYARHGFKAIGVVEAPGYPQIIAMWRPARRPGGRQS